MGITRIQTAVGTGSTSTFSATFSMATTAGNFLIAIVQCEMGDFVVTPPVNFSLAESNLNVNGAPIYLYYQANAPSITLVSGTLNYGAHNNVFIGEYSGLVTTGALDQYNTGTAATGTTPSGSITIAFSYELIVAGLSNAQGDTYSGATNGFNLVRTAGDGGSVGAVYLDYFTSSPGTFSTTCTIPTSDGGNGVIASFKSTASGIASNAIFFSGPF
jgi:hypothetical protein